MKTFACGIAAGASIVYTAFARGALRATIHFFDNLAGEIVGPMILGQAGGNLLCLVYHSLGKDVELFIVAV